MAAPWDSRLGMPQRTCPAQTMTAAVVGEIKTGTITDKVDGLEVLAPSAGQA